MGIEETLTQKFGPLAAWQWGILAGGGMFVARKYLSSVKTPGVTSVTLTPSNGPGTAAATTTASDVGGALGSLSAFLNAIPTQAGTFGFTMPDGTTITWDNGIPKFNPPATPPAPPNPPGTPPIQPPNPLPPIRPGGPIDPHTPDPLPPGRGPITPIIPIIPPGIIRDPHGPTPPVIPPVTPPMPPRRPGGPIVPGTPPPLPFLGR
jgi:hypothetical protein